MYELLEYYSSYKLTLLNHSKSPLMENRHNHFCKNDFMMRKITKKHCVAIFYKVNFWRNLFAVPPFAKLVTCQNILINQSRRSKGVPRGHWCPQILAISNHNAKKNVFFRARLPLPPTPSHHTLSNTVSTLYSTNVGKIYPVLTSLQLSSLQVLRTTV